jgi:DNA-binding MarR family transcriptional regulator
MKQVKQKEPELQLDAMLKASFLFEAAIHPLRHQLLSLLIEEDRVSIKTLCYLLDLEEATCVQQLSILCGVGLLIRKTDEEDVYYTVHYEKLHQLYLCADALLEE